MTETEQLIADAKEAGMTPAYGCKTRHDIESDDCPCDENGNCTQGELVGFEINRIENLDVITAFAAIRDKRKDAEIVRLRHEESKVNAWTTVVREEARKLGLSDEDSNGSIADWKLITKALAYGKQNE